MLPLVHTFDGGGRFEALFSHWAHQSHTIRLQGGWDARGMGRYTVLGFDPYRVIYSTGDQVHRVEGGRVYREAGDPFQALAAEYDGLRLTSINPDVKLPFQGGALGYLGYDLRHWVEAGLDFKSSDIPMPDMYFAFYDVVCVYDNLDERGYILSSGLPERGDAARRKARRRLDRVVGLVDRTNAFPDITLEPSGGSSSFLENQVSTFDKDTYVAAINKAKHYIRQGEIYQVNLSQRFAVEAPLDSPTLFRILRQANPAPFGAYVNGSEWAVISVSPERFFRFDGNYVETRPIKGTRPRGKNPVDDEKLRKELLASEKDRAEHVMIVDLARSDLARFCSSVEVTEFMVCEAHPTVWHLVSTVRGVLNPRISPIEAVRSAFPGSSISGAPKARAMAIIDELEPVARGVYTGAIGYLGLGGAIDLNVAIRTICHVDDTAYFHVGGAIVADSDPVEEYEETLAKGLGIARGIDEARRMAPGDSNQ